MHPKVKYALEQRAEVMRQFPDRFTDEDKARVTAALAAAEEPTAPAAVPVPRPGP